MDLIELIKAAVFGIVEGITEWLPISSTGHMLLLNQFLTMDVSEDFWNMFLVVIQLGAILAVCVIFFHKLNPFSRAKSAEERRGTWSLWAKTVVACLPEGVNDASRAVGGLGGAMNAGLKTDSVSLGRALASRVSASCK